ncbi:MAG: hypothetical protein MMC23_007373 [Stictis urceolatum]|nr:hypothetical protein [Stictis urceolata]
MADVKTIKRMTLEKYRKRLDSVFHKANQLNQLTKADIFVVAFFKGRFSVYNSTKKPGWPPKEETLKAYFPESNYRGPDDYCSKTANRNRDDLETSQSRMQQSKRRKCLRLIIPVTYSFPVARVPPILPTPCI